MFFETKNLDNTKVFDIISNDFRYAKALNSFGIDFYDHYDLTINEVCKEKGLSSNSIYGYRVAMDESFDLDLKTLESSPLNLVIEYLKHNHSYFIKNKLPYIKNLIASLSNKNKRYNFFEDLNYKIFVINI